jgi:autotransporter-associated beta strand protein
VANSIFAVTATGIFTRFFDRIRPKSACGPIAAREGMVAFLSVAGPLLTIREFRRRCAISYFVEGLRILPNEENSPMKKQPTRAKPGGLPGLSEAASSAAILLAAVLILSAPASHADSATWNLDPGSGEWVDPFNWTPTTVPNGPADVATFDSSNVTDLLISAQTEVDRIVFNANASPFTITANPIAQLTLSGVGIMNNSGTAQNFVTAAGGSGQGGLIQFTNSATAGNLTTFTNNGGAVSGAEGGGIVFHDSSSAEDGTFTTNSGAVSRGGGAFTEFHETATAGNGMFTTNGAAVIRGGRGFTAFYDNSTADNGTLIANGAAVAGGHGGLTMFFDTSSAGNSTLIANGGVGTGPLAGATILFFNDSTGGTAQVKVFDNGYLDLNGHNLPGLAIGSLEGNGDVFLGADNLAVGTLNSNQVFSGELHDGDSVPGGRTGGSLTKVGTGRLILTNANTHIGGTTIEDGQLVVNNRTGSGTGSGPVQVNAGSLGGRGIIAGAVTVGTGSGSGAFLSPGKSSVSPGTLTIQSTLAFNSDATCKFILNSRRAAAGKVVANGVAIGSGALFSPADFGNSALPSGTVFTVIDNTATTPIAGTFSNLADGSTFTLGSNTFQVSYEGGDGNDLTVTVVP